jgi:hypothetical protein
MLMFKVNDVNADASASSSSAGGSTSAYAASQGVLEQFKDLKDAIDNFVIGSNAKTIIDNINKSITSMNDSALALQRSMGGVAMGTDEFREKLTQAYYTTLELGSSFKDITDGVEGLASGMGRMVNPSQETLINMVQISKASGIGTKEVGEMVAEMVKFGGTQLQATEKIHDLSVVARQAGLSAKGYTTEIQKNLKTVAGFGFKNGIDGMAKMVKQAMLLRTNIESIGAKSVQNTALDPEGAIELAANFQMLGGAVGKLADPFQLMYMAQNDVAGLQDELIKSTKAAAVFNKETGKFDISTEDMYRLRQQAQLTGSNLEDLVETGKEAAKMDYLKDAFDIGSMPEDTQSLIAGLAEIGEGGKVSIDIPGFKKLEADTAEGLKAQLASTDTQKALKDYQDKAGMSEEKLAIAQMTIQENQAKDVNIIKEAVLQNMGKTGRQQLLTSITGASTSMGSAALGVANVSAGATGLAVKEVNDVVAAAADAFEISETTQRGFSTALEVLKTNYGVQPPEESANDLFVGKSSAVPKVMAAGKIYKGIVGDEVAMGTNLGDAFNKVGKNQTIDMGGKLDININVGGSVGGDSGTVAKMFEDPAVQKKIMDTVLYKLEMYKKQKGVLA